MFEVLSLNLVENWRYQPGLGKGGGGGGGFISR